jgi:hypothetical protein
MSSPVRHAQLLLVALTCLGVTIPRTAQASSPTPFCPLVTEYAEVWTDPDASLPATLYGYGSVETCGTSSPVDMLLELKHGGSTLDYAWQWGYSFVDAYVDMPLTDTTGDGDYFANVQAWLEEEHFGCYDAVANITSFAANYQKIQDYGGGRAVYYRCNTGPCLSMAVQNLSSSYSAPYLRLGILRVSYGGFATCHLGTSYEINNCNYDPG